MSSKSRSEINEKENVTDVVRIGTAIPCLGYFFQIEHTVPVSFARDSNKVGDLLSSIQRNVFFGLGAFLGLSLCGILWLFCSDFYREKIKRLESEMHAKLESVQEEVKLERLQFSDMLKSKDNEKFVSEIKRIALEELKTSISKESELILADEMERSQSRLISLKGQNAGYPPGVQVICLHGQDLNKFLTRSDIVVFDINLDTLIGNNSWIVIYKEKSINSEEEDGKAGDDKKPQASVKTDSAKTAESKIATAHITTLSLIFVLIVSLVFGPNILC